MTYRTKFYRARAKERDVERQEYFKKIMKLANSMLTMDYQKFVHEVAFYLGLNYKQQIKKGVYMDELDILIGIGKLCKTEDGVLTVKGSKPKKIST